MTSPVLAVAGVIASGKTTISRHIATALGWPWASFGAYVRGEAQRRGLPNDRLTLQHLGDELIGFGLEPFCYGVLAEAGWQAGLSVVLDGIRHAHVVYTLRALVNPQPLILAFVSIPEDIRAIRLQARGIDLSTQQQYDHHANEADVLTTLPQLADIVLDGSQSLENIISHLVGALK